MPYFSISSHPGMPITVVKVTDKRPKTVDKSDFQLRFIAEVHGDAVYGAEETIVMIDERMGKKCKAPGVYQASYSEVRPIFDEIVSKHANASKHTASVRVLAGIAAIGLLFAMCVVAVPAAVGWMAVCAFKKQSGLRAMAETAVVWSIFDWKPLILRLGRIARYGK